MAEIELLDVDLPIGLTSDGKEIKATAYFEDFLFKYAQRMGGEGEDRFETITVFTESETTSLAALAALQQQVGSGDFLTCDDTGFTCDATVFSCDQDEA